MKDLEVITVYFKAISQHLYTWMKTRHLSLRMVNRAPRYKKHCSGR